MSGVYRPPDSAASYWFDNDLFDFRPSVGDLRDPRPAHLDAVFVTQNLLHALTIVTVQATAERLSRWQPSESTTWSGSTPRWLGMSTEPNAEHVVRQDTHLPAVIADINDERAFVRTATLLVGAQLLVLAWFALALVVTTTSDARTGEVALAKLRGLPVRATMRARPGRTTPATRPGVTDRGLLAYVTGRLLVQRFLVPATPVRPGWPVGRGRGTGRGRRRRDDRARIATLLAAAGRRPTAAGRADDPARSGSHR